MALMLPTKNEIRDWIEWLYRLLQPRAANRIAILVILGGLALLVTPIWEPIVEALCSRLFGISIQIPNLPGTGITLIVSGLIYHSSYIYIEIMRNIRNEDSKRRNLEEVIIHDRKIANRFRELIPESTKDRFVYHLLNEHIYWSNDLTQISDSHIYLTSYEAHFLNSDLQRVISIHNECMNRMFRFLERRFFVYPNTQEHSDNMRYAMQPNWNIDRDRGSTSDMIKYDNITKELEELIEAYDESYRNVIFNFHERLLE